MVWYASLGTLPTVYRHPGNADLGGDGRSLAVSLNGTAIGEAFADPGSESCPSDPASDRIVIPLDVFLSLVADGNALVGLTPQGDIDPAACDGTSLVSILLQYQSFTPMPDVNGNGKSDPCELAHGDSNLDGTVDIDDFLAVLAAWGPCPDPCPADSNLDGIVDIDDFLIVLANWG